MKTTTNGGETTPPGPAAPFEALRVQADRLDRVERAA
jgi:hypothetical protein